MSGMLDGKVVLVNGGTLLDTTPDLVEAHITVNLRGPFFAMQGRRNAQSRTRAPVGPHPDQRRQHRLDRDRG